jgi:hypothetical protein
LIYVDANLHKAMNTMRYVVGWNRDVPDGIKE